MYGTKIEVHMGSQIETIIIFLHYLTTMLYVISETTMVIYHIFVEVTQWKLIDKTRKWIPFPNKIRNPHDFGKGSKSKKISRRNLCLWKPPFMLKKKKQW
jgi:hypothetical protein